MRVAAEGALAGLPGRWGRGGISGGAFYPLGVSLVLVREGGEEVMMVWILTYAIHGIGKEEE